MKSILEQSLEEKGAVDRYCAGCLWKRSFKLLSMFLAIHLCLNFQKESNCGFTEEKTGCLCLGSITPLGGKMQPGHPWGEGQTFPPECS